MKATGIVRRVDDLGRIVIPKEIRRTLRIREGDPLHTTLTSFDLFLRGVIDFAKRITGAQDAHEGSRRPDGRRLLLRVRQIGIGQSVFSKETNSI